MSKRILILAGDFVEDYELMVPFQCLKMLGYTVDVVCPNKKVDEQIKTAIHDFEGDQTYTEKPGHNFTLNASFDAIDQNFNSANKPIASVCHGILILAAAGIIANKTCSCYPACAPDVALSGGTWADIGFESAIVDGNLVTAAAWPAHPEWLAKFNELLVK
jgi:protease I